MLDILGNRMEVHDARALTPLTYTYNMLKAVVMQISIDSGTQHTLTDAAGQPLYLWDADSREFHFTYDALRRQLTKEVTPSGGSTKVLEVKVYGEGVSSADTHNLRGEMYQVYDGAGLETIADYDFKGNPTSFRRQFVDDPTQSPDWTTIGSVTMETGYYDEAQSYDALNRTVSITTPDTGVTTYNYEASGMLFSVAISGVHSLTSDIVNEIYYNAKGQRIKIKYENGATTTYEHDPNTFRVTRIRTTRSSDSAVLQDLKYWYDPVGNITTQEDAANQPVYYSGTVASPDNDYTYDALYRLIIAKGRELAGNNGAPTYNDNSRVGINGVPISSTDTAAMRTYIQYYSYDEVGNMLQMKHTATGGTGNWKRNFTIRSTNNQLTDTSVGSNSTSAESYTYDNRGNITAGFNHLTSLAYNEDNHLEKVVVNANITSYYQYDYQGQRARKVTIDTGSSLKHSRKYFGSWEQYQKIDTGTNSIILERETLSVMDNSARLALIDTPTIDTTSSGEVQLLRYQFSNHLSTATLELDNSAAVISYEEYYPFGSTSFQSGRSAAEVSLKRYRYTGKEKDEETGLYYHGARYYAPWIGRWIAVDPLEKKFSPESPYNYGHNNPIKWQDSTGKQADTTNTGGGSTDSGNGGGGNANTNGGDKKDNSGGGDKKEDGKGGTGKDDNKVREVDSKGHETTRERREDEKGVYKNGDTWKVIAVTQPGEKKDEHLKSANKDKKEEKTHDHTEKYHLNIPIKSPFVSNESPHFYPDVRRHHDERNEKKEEKKDERSAVDKASIVAGATDVSRGSTEAILEYGVKASKAASASKRSIKMLEGAFKGARVAGFVFGLAAGTYSIYKGVDAWRENDPNKKAVAVKAALDVAVIALSLWGGPVGWAIGGAYFLADAAGAFKWGERAQKK